MKSTMVRSAVFAVSLLACSATASDPTEHKPLILPTHPVAGGPDFPSVMAQAMRAVSTPAGRDQVEAHSGTDPYADFCRIQLWSGFINIGDDQQIDFGGLLFYHTT